MCSVRGMGVAERVSTSTLLLSCLKLTLEVFHIGIGIAITLSLAEAHTINNRSMIQSIGNDGIIGREQRFKHTTVGIETSCVENGILGLKELRDGSLKFLMYILRTADKAHARHTITATIHHILSSLDEARIVGKTQVVVSTEVEYFLALHLNSGLLRTFNKAFFFIKTGFFNFLQFVLKVLLEFTVHLDI